MAIILHQSTSPLGFHAIDDGEKEQLFFETANAVDPRDSDVASFTFPVDRAISFKAEEIRIHNRNLVHIRDGQGVVVGKAGVGFDENSVQNYQKQNYELEFQTPIKLYSTFKSQFKIRVKPGQIELSFPDEVTVKMGFRSYHEKPSATITTTTDPADMMSAITTLSSSLKDLTPERSWNTLRGHPPLIDIGDELNIPDGVEPPDTGVTIQIPPVTEYIYAVSPLSFYLGATLEPGSPAKLMCDNGFELYLGETIEAFCGVVEELLKRILTLDCCTRTVGHYEIDLHEAQYLAANSPIDYEELYTKPIQSQIQEYLRIDTSVLSQIVPEWPVSAQIEPTVENIEYIPYLLDEMTIIKPFQNPSDATTSNRQNVDLGTDQITTVPDGGSYSRTNAISTNEETNLLEELSYLDHSFRRVWVGDGVSITSRNAVIEGYRNRVGGADGTDDRINFVVVCNADTMVNEQDVVSDIYAEHDESPFSLTIYNDTTTAELAEILESRVDFFHFIGHVEKDGFVCEDGNLDTSTLDSVNVRGFFLNACKSYTQAHEMIRQGALTGVATVADVVNIGAKTVGGFMAQMLSMGLPFESALRFAQAQYDMGDDYCVVGTGGSITRAENVVMSFVHHITPKQDGTYTVRYEAIPTNYTASASVFTAYLQTGGTYYLYGNNNVEVEVSENRLVEFLSELPVIVGTHRGEYLLSGEYMDQYIHT